VAPHRRQRSPIERPPAIVGVGILPSCFATCPSDGARVRGIGSSRPKEFHVRAESANQAKDRFLPRGSHHELRTPLNPLLRGDLDAPSRPDSVNRKSAPASYHSREHLPRGSEIVYDLLDRDSDRLRQCFLILQLEITDCHSLLRNAWRSVRNDIKQDLRLEARALILPQVPLHWADLASASSAGVLETSSKLRSSRRTGDDHDPHPERMRKSQKPGAPTIELTDTGKSGIEPEVMSRISIPFTGETPDH